MTSYPDGFIAIALSTALKEWNAGHKNIAREHAEVVVGMIIINELESLNLENKRYSENRT